MLRGISRADGHYMLPTGKCPLLRFLYLKGCKHIEAKPWELAPGLKMAIGSQQLLCLAKSPDGARFHGAEGRDVLDKVVHQRFYRLLVREDLLRPRLDARL